jgi:hypothetical protein
MTTQQKKTKFILLDSKTLNYPIINFVLLGSKVYTQNLLTFNYDITNLLDSKL